jgi:hypothetical protein
MSAEQKSRDELLIEVPEQDIVLTMKQTLERTRDWYRLHDRPIPATDIQCYINAYEEILKLEAWPDEDPHEKKSVN